MDPVGRAEAGDGLGVRAVRGLKTAYASLAEVAGVKLLVETYFTDLPAEAYK